METQQVAAAAGAAVSLTPADIAAIVASEVDKALKAFAARTAPVGGVTAAGGGRSVRVKLDAEPPHGEPVDRVGVVDSEHSRCLLDGKEELVLNVRFVNEHGVTVLEQHCASALVGA